MCSREISYHSCVRKNRPGNRNGKNNTELQTSAGKLPNEETTSLVSEASPTEARAVPSSIRGKLSKTLSKSFLFGRSKSTIGISTLEPEYMSAELQSLRRKITRSKSFHLSPAMETPAIRGFKHVSPAHVDANCESPLSIPTHDHSVSRFFPLHPRFLRRHKKHVTFVTKPTIIPPSPYYLNWDDQGDLAPTYPDVVNLEMLDPSSPSPEKPGEINDPSSPTSDVLPVEMEQEAEANAFNMLV